jgi:ATP-binding cassette subfamily B protein
VFEGLNLNLLGGKVNAIVGTSGSGKTTLLKLLLKFYALEAGEIRINGIDLNSLRSSSWRGMCGVVMQDGYVFGDTIAHNIALGEEEVNYAKLIHAAQVANIHEFIAGLPLGYNTKIGSEGMGISMGQKQRILIARAVYKDPDFIFFDEATSSLDANNEHEIMHKLGAFFEGKTVVVVAHRLSTVRNADQIIVLEDGKVAEIGTHQDLLDREGMYYRLINKQLT